MFDYLGVAAVLRDRGFVAEEYPAASLLGLDSSGGYRDSEVYRRLRRALAEPEFLEEWRVRIREAGSRLLRDRNAELCLVRDFAQPLMLSVTGKLIQAEVQQVERWGNALSNFADTGTQFQRAQAAGREVLSHIATVIAGSVDTYSVYPAIQAAEANARVADAAQSLMVMLAAGHGTTSDMIANSTMLLVKNGVRLCQLRDERTLNQFVDEVFRLDPAIALVSRIALNDCVVGDLPIKGGEPLVLGLTSANRDESTFEQGDALILGREGKRHLAFGWGPSFCIGASFARIAVTSALSALASRATEIELTDRAPERKLDATLRGWRSMQVRLIA